MSITRRRRPSLRSALTPSSARCSLTLLLLLTLACDGGAGYIAALPTDSDGCITQFCTIPDGHLVFDSDRSGTHEIWSMSGSGGLSRKITDDLSYESWAPRLAPDRRHILFLRRAHGAAESYTGASLWVINADGTGLKLLRGAGRDGWTMQGHAEWSPDGRQIAIFGGVDGDTQIYLLDANGTTVRQVTDRAGFNADASWSPDGSRLLFTGCPGTPCSPDDYEIYSTASTGGTVTRLTTNTVPDHDPYFSPDGTAIAWLQKTSASGNGGIGTWALMAMDYTGGNQHPVIDDGEVNGRPSWSLLGDWLYFHRMEPATSPRWRIFRSRPDGSGLVEVPTTGNSEYPDPGR